MNSIIKILTLTFAITLNSCSVENKSTETELLYTEVMAIHDEVMPKMADIQKEIRKANNIIKKKSWSSPNDSIEITLLKKNLERADQEMWDWMHGFNQDNAKGEQAKSYLLDEKEKISNVRDQMLNSIKNIENYYQSL